MDKLKNYIKQNRAAMDMDMPPDLLWQNIEVTHLPPRVADRFVKRLMQYAAAAVLILSIATGVWMISKNKRERPVSAGIIPSAERNSKIAPAVPGYKQSTRYPTPLAKVAAAKARRLMIRQRGHYHKPDNFPVELAALDKSYTYLINYQMQQLRSTPVYAEGPNYFNVFRELLSQIRADEQKVADDIKRYGLNDFLLEQIINIYQRKLSTLKSLQSEINKMNNKVRGRANDLQEVPFYLDL